MLRFLVFPHLLDGSLAVRFLPSPIAGLAYVAIIHDPLHFMRFWKGLLWSGVLTPLALSHPKIVSYLGYFVNTQMDRDTGYDPVTPLWKSGTLPATPISDGPKYGTRIRDPTMARWCVTATPISDVCIALHCAPISRPCIRRTGTHTGRTLLGCGRISIYRYLVAIQNCT